jgi:hypothetical protein
VFGERVEVFYLYDIFFTSFWSFFCARRHLGAVCYHLRAQSRVFIASDDVKSKTEKAIATNE